MYLYHQLSSHNCLQTISLLGVVGTLSELSRMAMMSSHDASVPGGINSFYFWNQLSIVFNQFSLNALNVVQLLSVTLFVTVYRRFLETWACRMFDSEIQHCQFDHLDC